MGWFAGRHVDRPCGERISPWPAGKVTEFTVFVGDRLLSSADAGRTYALAMRVLCSPMLDINILHPWVQEYHPVLALGSGGRGICCKTRQKAVAVRNSFQEIPNKGPGRIKNTTEYYHGPRNYDVNNSQGNNSCNCNCNLAAKKISKNLFMQL